MAQLPSIIVQRAGLAKGGAGGIRNTILGPASCPTRRIGQGIRDTWTFLNLEEPNASGRLYVRDIEAVGVSPPLVGTPGVGPGPVPIIRDSSAPPTAVGVT